MAMSFADQSDIAACRTLLRTGSFSFHAASLLLPRSVRDQATALYAFCRIADDAVDLGTDRHEAVARLTMRLDLAYAGTPLPQPVDRAFAGLVAHDHIPKILPSALIEGLAWDAEGRRYETMADLLAYAMRVAGSVGVMMALIMGVRDHASLARAADLGIAMQLTNIARDVGEDARAGRIYLPLAWLTQAGISPHTLCTDTRFNPALASIIAKLLAVADELYSKAESGIGCLPFFCRPGIGAARLIYAAIGTEIARAGFDSINQRARVTGGRKLALAARALLCCVVPRGSAAGPALPQASQLVAAACIADGPAKINWFVNVLTIFERLERLERAQRAQKGGGFA
ncbi:MAG TPA: phytoene/squalene synthase family protein [Acetobacteraceae bacterium]|nr:phytoene/squalene synthase family protein [Acetobacteraceae bacterium]HQU01215.1 phytoene/squalene synthase family protein [Acetobacteraceae bacterium]